MIFSTEGILLKREPMKDFNEKLIFFTKDLGKVVIYAFGTRSLNSLRGKLLASFGWVHLELEKTKERYVLKELVQVSNNESHWQEKNFVLDFAKLLSQLTPKVPFEAKTQELYNLLQILTCKAVAQYPRSYRVFGFYLTVLCELGIMPDWSGCSLCGEYCSTSYNFGIKDDTQGITGTDCLKLPRLAKLPANSNANILADEIVLRLEEVYFLHYATIRYKPELHFFATTLASLKKFSQSEYVFTSPKTSPNTYVANKTPAPLDPEVRGEQNNNADSGEVLKINWQTVIKVLEKILSE